MKASNAVIRLDDLTDDLFTDVSVIELVKHLTEIGQRIDKEHLRKSLIFFFMNIENGYRENNLEKTTGAIVTLFRKTSLNDYVDYLQIGLMAHYGVPVGEEERSVNSLEVADRILDHSRILGFVVNTYLRYIELYKEVEPI